jgi:hypothetical protein
MEAHTVLLDPPGELERRVGIKEVFRPGRREKPRYDRRCPFWGDFVGHGLSRHSLGRLVHQSLAFSVGEHEQPGCFRRRARPQRNLVELLAAHFGPQALRYLPIDVEDSRSGVFPGGGHLHHICLAISIRYTSGRRRRQKALIFAP